MIGGPRPRLTATAAALLVGWLAGCGGGSAAQVAASSDGSVPPGPAVKVGAAPWLSVEVADDVQERAVGLSGRSELTAGSGMVFLYPQPRPGGFWMQDTLIPLSIAWVRDEAVVAIDEMEPCQEQPCPISYPNGDPDVLYELAVEAAAGLFTDAGVRPGDPVELRGLGGVQPQP